MKKTIIYLTMILGAVQYSLACGPSWEPELEYYNLFMQEIIDDPQYYPFLVSLDSEYYASSKSIVPNENIEEWQQYLKITYNDANYLVFKATKAEIDSLTSGKSVTNPNLHFADPAFTKRYKQALLYLSYAKYLEPYMSITRSDTGWYYREKDEETANTPDYKKVISILQKSWKAESDKELKLRYGYQLVRFAHYNRNYQDAVDYFNTYVEPLNYNPAMYYHALCQKAGAEKGLGNENDARTDFFRVFVHSKNLKTVALTSMKFENYNNLDFNDFLEDAQAEKEKNDAYLLLGFNSFNNPLNEAEKILATSPDAIQAKVLIARAINLLERDIMPIYYYFYWNDYLGTESPKVNDPRYPIISGEKTVEFFNNTRNLVIQTAQNKNVKDKNFWDITAAYLCFLNKEYAEARNYLDKVGNSDNKYTLQKKRLAMYIDVSEHPQITKELEIDIYNKYKDILEKPVSGDYYSENFSLPDYNTQNFVIDVLANRYFLQKDYAKSFLLNNNIFALEKNPQLSLLNDIESFYRKFGKNAFESYIAKRILSGKNSEKIDVFSSLNHIRGYIHLSKADFDNALSAFSKVRKTDMESHTRAVFGYNRIECFDCRQDTVMKEDFMQDFPYIPNLMNEKELAEVLVKLRKTALQSNELAARANYLLGNFFYNTSSIGYFRPMLRFGYNKENFSKKIDIYNNIYFKYYEYYYDNMAPISKEYLERALSLAKNNELKAKILFALSKCEQENYYDNYTSNSNDDGFLISGRHYFKELSKYKDTEFFDEVQTHCKYFDYYVRYCMK